MPKLLKAAKPAGLKPEGTINSELAAIDTEMLPTFCSVPPERSKMPLTLRAATPPPPLKNPLVQQVAVDLQEATGEEVTAGVADRQQGRAIRAAGLLERRRRTGGKIDVFTAG